MRTPYLAALCAVLLGSTPVELPAARPPATLALPVGARIGIVNLLDPEVTHFHGSRQIENSFLKTYTVNWSVSGMLLAAVKDRLSQLGFSAVPLAPSDPLRRARESVISETANGEPFLIAPLSEAALERREKLFAGLYLAVGLVGVVICAWAIRHTG